MDASEQRYLITGRVIGSQTRLGIAGLHVEAWDRDHVIDDAIGSSLTDTSGNFQIGFTQDLFGEKAPSIFFKVYSRDTVLADTERSTTWNAANGDAPVEITVAWYVPQAKGQSNPGCDQSSETSYTVSGSVLSPDSASVGGLHVQIVDKGIGEDFVFVDVVTDPCGNYTGTFGASIVAARGKQRPDVQARAYSNGTFVGASEVRYNASGVETLDVILEKNQTALPSEHQALTSSLARHFAGSLATLREDDNQQDITYLANKSGWDARAVAMASLAQQFSNNSVVNAGDVPIDAAYFYALFRAGLPANENKLYHTDATTLRTIWEQARGQGIITQVQADTVDTVLTRFHDLCAKKLLTAGPLVGISSVNSLLDASSLSTGQKTQFATLYADHRDDMDALWNAVRTTMGDSVATRLQLDGKLAYLTVNNGPLISALHGAVAGGLTDPLQLASAGFHRSDRWSQIITGGIQIPNEIPGSTDAEKHLNYADYLAAQVRLSYPTACVAEMVQSGVLPVNSPAQVHQFLTDHQGSFEIGVNPIDQYLSLNNVSLDPATTTEVKRLSRVYQMTTDDGAMGVLLGNGLDAAAHVVQFDRDNFVATYGGDLGGDDAAGAIHDRSVQIHNTVLNLTMSYLTAKTAVPIGTPPMEQDTLDSDSARQVLQPAPKGPIDLPQTHAMHSMAKTGGGSPPALAAYGTLESIFGNMDFCACDHCRSVLSPAAYLVDLLHFVDNTAPPGGSANPLTALLARRPDIEYLPLTCENTNTALPYIDVVNETLEYYITNASPLSLQNYVGHDTGTSQSEDLLASPRFVIDAAYTTLLNQNFPMPLPFHQPLENLRRHFEKFEVALPLALERLRTHNNLERGGATFGWRDIMMEEVRLSRAENKVLTDSTGVPLWSLYGFPTNTIDSNVIAGIPNVQQGIANAKAFCRRVGITYEELAAVLRTRFINPNCDLIPKVERLGVSFVTLAQLKAGPLAGGISAAQFNAMLPTGAGTLDPAEYGGNIANWVTDNTNYARIMGLITLTDTTNNADPCSFDTIELRFATPMANVNDTSTRLTAVEYFRLMRFIRLWKKLGWTIEQTDAAICALFNTNLASLQSTDIDTKGKLDTGFLTLLPRLGVVIRILRTLNLRVERDLTSVLATWSDIGTHGPTALYRQMFLNPTILSQDAVFADNGFGEFLQNNAIKLFDHAESLRAAFNITADEYDRIVTALGYNANTVLNIANISALFRRAYLARALRISVQELLLMIGLTGLDPFAAPDPTAPATLLLASLLQDMRDMGLKSASALYLVWNQDLSGQSAPTAAQTNEFARVLRDDFIKIGNEFGIVDDPTGEIARSRMTLVYGTAATDFFFGLLNETFVSSASYSHYASSFGTALASAVATAGGTYGSPAVARVGYDDFRKVVTFTGILDIATRNAIKAVVNAATVIAEATADGQLGTLQAQFPPAIDALFTANDKVVTPFFARYPELLPLYQAFLASPDPVETKRSTLLANFLPALVSGRKTLQALQRLADAAQTERAFAEKVANPTVVSTGLNAVANASAPAVSDLLALETPGLLAKFYDGNTVAGGVPHAPLVAGNLVYAAATSNTLPANGTNPGNPICGVWSGYVEAPENGLYNIYIDAEAQSTVTVSFGGSSMPLTQVGTTWHNTSAITLKAGTLYAVSVTVEKVQNTVRIQWQTAGRGLAPIATRLLYPDNLMSAGHDSYVRFLKGAMLAATLNLTASEVTRPQLANVCWLNALPVTGNANTPSALVAPLHEVLDHARMKAAIAPDDESLLTILNNPAAATANANSLLYVLTGWDAASFAALEPVISGGALTSSPISPVVFRRYYDAMTVVLKMGIASAALIAATTNEPTATMVRDLQAALRARYALDDWRSLVQPISDQMRSLQRDALVAYILHQLRNNPSTQKIDTPEKLFEYFLMDVEMEPCMQTSRIRHALSSVQLFVERCVMNLEPTVSPAAINATQWEWMKRYRVWEANRKVFLYPENWLEPELRDDKSPFFKEIESELLQSDITEETASVALLNYLAKLEEVAKLEPVAIFHQPDTHVHPGEVNHVIARTPGAQRKYYYRRREYGYWTPWELVKLDIEDNPVVPVIWGKRLLLFWLRILKRGNVDPASIPTSNNTSTVGNMSMSQLTGEAKTSAKANGKMTVQAILCWSEYHNGKWQQTKTSDPDNPVTVGTHDAGGTLAFKRSDLDISTREEGDTLRVEITSAGSSISCDGSVSWIFYNTHSLPQFDTNFTPVCSVILRDRWFTGNLGNDFSLTYVSAGGSPSITRQILSPALPYKYVWPMHPVSDVWESPMFYYDSRHAFYVTTAHHQVPIPVYSGIVFGTATSRSGSSLPPIVLAGNPGPAIQVSPWVNGGGVSLGTPAGSMNAVQQFVTEDANIHQGIGSTVQVTFGSRNIGAAGSMPHA
ncbi:MAG TPA: neuraminidase-like domain-containing protein [Candidatus Kapabacteria bacterium]|nr:neuraminidase-like domain-containing protein [Candidatus Kapabacteria bacterium]